MLAAFWLLDRAYQILSPRAQGSLLALFPGANLLKMIVLVTAIALGAKRRVFLSTDTFGGIDCDPLFHSICRIPDP